MAETKDPGSVDQKEDQIDPLDPKNFEGLTINQKLSEQRSAIAIHYVDAYDNLPQASRDPTEVKKAIRELIKDKGLFTLTGSEEQSFRDPAFAEDDDEKVSADYLRRWINDTVNETVATLQNLGKIDKPKEKE